jgi:hypothetical protein
MSKIPGSLPITGFIGTTFATDTYPTHIDELGKGGYRSVANIQARDAISAERRSIGMMCYVVSETKAYQLIGGLGNEFWKEFEAIPPLGVFDVGGITYPEIFIGTDSGKPEASQSFGYALIDIAFLNARFLTGNFIMGDAPVQAKYPAAQFIANLTDGLLAKTGSTLRSAESGIDFVDIEAQLCYESAIPVWLTNENKTLTSSKLRIIDGTFDDGDDLQGIRNLTAKGGVIARSAITSNDSVFGLNNLGTREVKIYDRIDQGAGRLTRSVNFISAYNLAGNVNFYLPETSSSLGKVLADVGETTYDSRIFRKLDFVEVASNAAKYIIQQPNENLPNAQALSTLGLGLVKTTANGVLAQAIAGTDYVTPLALEEETSARIEADSVLEGSIATVAAETQAQITAITGYGSLALLTEFLADIGWSTGYSEYLWNKYRPLRTYNSYADTDKYDKDGGNVRYDASHIGNAGAYKPGLRITSWDSSTVFSNDLFPVSMGLFGFRKQLGVTSVQDGIIWQSYFENNSSSPHYRFPKNFGMYHVGHDEGSIGWNRQERLLMEYQYYDDKFFFEKKTEFKEIVKFSASAIGMSIGNTAQRPRLVDLVAGLTRINIDSITPSPDPTHFVDVLGTLNQIKVVQDLHNFTVSLADNVKLPGNAYTKIAVGNDNEKPNFTDTEAGMIRYNSELVTI